MATDLANRGLRLDTLAGRAERSDPGAVEARRAKPVKWWAAFGLAIVVLQLYVFAAWFASGDASPTPPGPIPLPGWMEAEIVFWEVASPIAFALFIWWFLIRPWRRARHLTLDGMLVLASLSLYWQDPIFNFTQNWAVYNAGLHNLGSWTTSIPGWISPNGNLFAEPLLFTGPVYVYAVFGAMVLANKVMRRAKARWPSLGTLGLIAICWAFIIGFELLAEGLWLRLGIWGYPGAIEDLTLFYGHYYQFPIYEIVLWGTTWTLLACVRYFVNDRGQTLAERGIDEVDTGPKRRRTLRLLALVGLLNAILIVCYSVPIQWFALHADPWPQDFLQRSYLTNGLCGPDTDFACSGPGVPIPRPESAHLRPDGTLAPGTR